jgi:hypothetical protein
MTDVIMRKQGNSLVPVDDQGSELLAKLKDGRDVGVTVTAHRNPRHHRLYWAMLRFLGDHTDIFAGKDLHMISTALKLATGLVQTYIDQDTGKTILVPRSINWASMDQTKFNRFFDNAVIVIANRWLPEGTLPDDVRRELIEMVDGPHAVAERQ